jgi:hypothetical protein
MITCRITEETALVVKNIQYSIAGSHTSYKVVKPIKNADFQIEAFTEHAHYYDILVWDGTKGILDGGHKEYLINVPKGIVTIANKHEQSESIDVLGCVESYLPICPRCHDTHYVKRESSTKCIPNPPVPHICTKCNVQWNVNLRTNVHIK